MIIYVVAVDIIPLLKIGQKKKAFRLEIKNMLSSETVLN